MKIEDLVLTIEQIDHLKELGVEIKNTALCWGDLWEKGKFILSRSDKSFLALRTDIEIIPTLTLQEILEMLPEEIRFEDQRAFLIIDKSDRQISYTAEDYDGNLNIDCIFF